MFKCPNCDGNRLEEVMSDVVVSSVIKDLYIEDDVANYDYDEQTNEHGHITCFQCVDCGFILKTNGELVRDLEGLAEWLVANSPE